MFQSLRPNSLIYIFHKGENPRLEKGCVVNQPIPKPKYQLSPTFGQPEMVIDLCVKINGQTYNYNGLPVNLDIADCLCNGETVTIADSREAMNSEIIALKQKSVDILGSVEFHRNLITNCDMILGELNPEFAEKKAQQDEINSLKVQIDDMSRQMSELMETNRSLIEHFKENVK